MKYEQILDILSNEAKTSKEALKLNDVNTFCTRLGLDEKNIVKVIHNLEDNGFLQVPKGFSSMSPLQKKIHRFINDELLEQLLKNGKATLIVSEEDLKSLSKNDDKCYVLNKKGDLIKPSCNNTNITNARRVKKAKEDFEKLNPSS